MKKILNYAFMDAFGTALYVAFVALFINFMTTILPDKTPILGPIAILMLLVFSVALVGSLIFGRPILMYLDGKKKEALSLLLCTLAIFFALTAAAFIFLISIAG